MMGENREYSTDLKTEEELEKYFDRLFPICRSITGSGFQESLDILREIIPLEKIDFSSGTDCYDWTIPDEWNVRDAYIITPAGEKIAMFKENNLHVVGYSSPVDKKISLAELKEHLHTLEDLPDAIPYVTSYYKRRWGFCIPFNIYKSLSEGIYKVHIDSDLKPGKLTVGNLTIPGETEQEILLNSFLCHPSMAVNELSGPLLLAFLYQKLKAQGPFKHTIRFVLCAENIGTIAFLSLFGDYLIKHLDAGLVINCVGHGDLYTYKYSRQGNSLVDRASMNVLKHQKKPVDEVRYYAGGSDERQYCSPGFNLPVGLIMRTMYGKYREYHTSLDNKALISFKAIRETIDLYFDVIKTIDENRKYIARVQKGTPQFSKSPISLYPSTMNANFYNQHDEFLLMMLELANLSDGEHDLLAIAEKRNLKMIDMLEAKDLLVKAGYLKEMEE
jgi:aminopeptidase-like protein